MGRVGVLSVFYLKESVTDTRDGPVQGPGPHTEHRGRCRRSALCSPRLHGAVYGRFPARDTFPSGSVFTGRGAPTSKTGNRLPLWRGIWVSEESARAHP